LKTVANKNRVSICNILLLHRRGHELTKSYTINVVNFTHQALLHNVFNAENMLARVKEDFLINIPLNIPLHTHIPPMGGLFGSVANISQVLAILGDVPRGLKIDFTYASF
jgi:hypothetical protein